MFKRLVSLVLIVFMLFPTIVSIADENDAEHTPSGSSRAGDTATWTATGNGGTTGFSDTTTYDDVDDDDIGTSASSNMAHKTGDDIEDKVGDWLGSQSKMKLSTIFWDGINGKYISVEETGFSPEKLLEIANIVKQYKQDAADVLHLTQDVQDMIEQKKQEFTDKFKRIDMSIFDINNYNPGGGIDINGGAIPNYNLTPPDGNIPPVPDTESFKEAVTERVVRVVLYKDYMKAEFGIDVEGTEYELRCWEHSNPNPTFSATPMCNYPVTPYKAAFYTQPNPNEDTVGHSGRRIMSNNGGYDTCDRNGAHLKQDAWNTQCLVFGRHWNLISGWDKHINYHLLNDPKGLYDPTITVVVFQDSFDMEKDQINPYNTYYFAKLESSGSESWQTLYHAIHEFNAKNVGRAIKKINAWFKERKLVQNKINLTRTVGSTVQNVAYVTEEAIDEWNKTMKAQTGVEYDAARKGNQKKLQYFIDNQGNYIPEDVEGSGYTIDQFKNVKEQLKGKKETALAAIVGGEELYDARLHGGSLQDIINALTAQNLENAQANADANHAVFDAANGEVIAEMLAGINDNTDFINGQGWPELGSGPSEYDYAKAAGILKATFNLSDEQLADFVDSLINTIQECYTESYAIEGIGPDGQIVDFETKEARYLALQAYLYLMCAKDTIDVQHVVVCEGNSYVNNVIMGQSPIQFPAEVVGSNGVANYCWAIQCVESPYAGDVGRYIAKATNGNQLSYRFTSPGKYRIVATRNMLSTIETVVAMTYHEYWYIKDTGQVIYSRIVRGHVNTTGIAQFNPAGRKGDDVCLYFNRHGEQSCYSDGDSETGIPGTVVFETYWTVTDGDGNYIPPAGAFGSDSSTRQTG